MHTKERGNKKQGHAIVLSTYHIAPPTKFVAWKRDPHATLMNDEHRNWSEDAMMGVRATSLHGMHGLDAIKRI